MERLKEKMNNINEQIRRLNSLFIQGIIDKAEHKTRYSILSDKIHILQSQLDKNQEERFDESEIQEMLSSFSRFSQAIKEQLKNPDFMTKRFMTEQLIQRVILSEKEITIEVSAPLTKSVLCTPNRESKMLL